MRTIFIWHSKSISYQMANNFSWLHDCAERCDIFRCHDLWRLTELIQLYDPVMRDTADFHPDDSLRDIGKSF